MSFAIGFARFREVQVKIDTIPKPVGLGSRGPLSGLYVRQPSGTCPGVCPASVRHRFGLLLELRS